jgi:hypothetical protein
LGPRKDSQKFRAIVIQEGKEKKNIMVQKALQDNKWISHILLILTPEEIHE